MIHNRIWRIGASATFLVLLAAASALNLFGEGTRKQNRLSDEEIKKQIIDQLYWDNRIDASNIAVTVQDGEVTLEGTVPTYAARIETFSDVWKVKGIRKVKNRLHVTYKPPVPTDKTIERNIRSLLMMNSTIESSDVNVSVYSGKVTLQGSVATVWERLKVENITADVRGVRNIKNEIVVVPGEKIHDELIAMEIVESLRRDVDVDVDSITVSVEDGVVTLSGTVPDWQARMAALEAALFTAGVRRIDNNIELLF
jgi:osmotically-inducible protein OsmY